VSEPEQPDEVDEPDRLGEFRSRQAAEAEDQEKWAQAENKWAHWNAWPAVDDPIRDLLAQKRARPRRRRRGPR
jgi:hypothetical protein